MKINENVGELMYHFPTSLVALLTQFQRWHLEVQLQVLI